MGAGASAAASPPTFDDIGKWSKEEVGEQVASIGGAFEEYKDIVINEAIDGRTLLEMDEDDLEEIGVTKKIHRKRMLKMIEEAKSDPSPQPSAAAAPVDDKDKAKMQLFMSYPRGEETTPFAHTLKAFLETNGFDVWMDVEGIAGGADFMSAIGDAIKASRGIVAIIDEKFCGSTYCNNELAMAQGNGLQLFPILFRSMSFDALPNGLQYMLASTNVIPFPDAASDAAGMVKMHDHVCSMLDVAPPTAPRRHSDSNVAQGAAAAEAVADTDTDTDIDAATAEAGTPPSQAAASIPTAVPDPPDVVCERKDVLSGMIGNLLGFLGTGSLSLSSVKKSKRRLSSHGSGGVGKTTLAAMLVRHPMVLRSFDRIGWVSVGQAPDILELQRSLYAQLTGHDMEAKPGASPEVQLQALQEASKGKHWLVVLDDVWDSSHEKLLNCVDAKTKSKLFVTTRIRGLLKGCDEISLELLTRGEAVDLLLRTGGVESTDEACAAAEQIADLCGDLPLFVGICGGIIADYDGAPEWQVELIKMLKEDRLMVMGATEDEEGETVHRVVGTSLAMLKNEAAESLFKLLSLCPEDVPIPVDAVSLIWKACQPERAAKVNALAVRKACKLLLDRNLLMGSTADGVRLHDIVRDFMRGKFDGNGGIRVEQRRIVQSIIAATPDTDWQPNTPLGGYVRQSLRQHMIEAMPEADPQDDGAVLSWLNASERVMTSLVVRTAAEVCGAEVLEAMSAAHEAQGEFLQAGLRLVSAAHTSARFYAFSRISKGADRGSAWTRTLLHASDCLDRVGDVSVAVRTLHFGFGSKLVLDNLADAGLFGALHPRMMALFDAGIAPATAHEAWKLAHAMSALHMAEFGGSPAGAGAALDIDRITKFLRGPGKADTALAQQGYALAVRDGLDAAIRAALVAQAAWPLHMSWCSRMATEVPSHLAWYTYERHKEMIERWEYPASHVQAMQTIGIDCMLVFSPDVVGLLRFGDIHLARSFVSRMAAAFEVIDMASVPTLATSLHFVLAHASSFFAELGTHEASLSLLRSFSCGFDTVQDTVQAHCHAFSVMGFAWTTHNDKGWFGMYSKSYHLSFAAMAKAAHWLHAPSTIDRETRCAFLDIHVEAVSGSEFVHHDAQFEMVSSQILPDVVRAMESVERYEEGVAEAQRVLKWFPYNPTYIIEANRALGRCQAKLGRTEEAEAAFQAAVAEAECVGWPYHEVLARSDYIQAVLDPASRREEQLAPLGKAIKALVLEPSEYDGVLGRYGLDSAAAVAAYEAIA